MTDKELLELAAKAVGLKIGDEVGEYGWHRGIAGAIFARRNANGTSMSWNPLIDDGDALRLAVSLEIDIELHVNVEAISWGRRENGEQRHVYQESGLSTDATRRAIVRAAAEIGKGMQ